MSENKQPIGPHMKTALVGAAVCASLRAVADVVIWGLEKSPEPVEPMATIMRHSTIVSIITLGIVYLFVVLAFVLNTIAENEK